MPSTLQRITNKISTLLRLAGVRDYGDRNRVLSASATLKNCRIQFFGNDNLITLEPGASAANLEITILGSRNKIHFGANAIFMNGTMWCAADDGGISIGEKTTITEAKMTLTESNMSITIGRDCLLAWGIDLRCGDGHPIIDRSTGIVINPAKPITIADHVWIAAHVQVLKGVGIGENSVIGAHSVVTNNIPAHCIAAGVPARVVRENITWSRNALESGEPQTTQR